MQLACHRAGYLSDKWRQESHLGLTGFSVMEKLKHLKPKLEWNREAFEDLRSDDLG